MSLSTLDQQVWKKVLAHKNSSMNEPQLSNSLPLIRPRDLQDSLANLLKFQLMTVSITPMGDKMYNAQKPEAKTASLASLTPEQKLVRSVIESSNSNGIPIAKLKRSVNPDSVPHANLRKILVDLEKGGYIKKFSAVSAPTTVLYHSVKYIPAAHLTGGVWYDDNKEFDEGLVQVVRDVLLDQVRKRTFREYGKKNNKNGESSTTNNQIFPAGRTPDLPSPKDLVKYIKKLNVVQAHLTKKEIMEVMRALVLDDLVEVIKPVGGMNRGESSDEDNDEDGEPSKKRVKAEHGDEEDDEMDDDEKERKKELAKEKEKERQRARKKREKEKEKQREKDKEKERKKKEKEKEKEKKRKRKEKEKAKKKKRKKADSSSESDSDAADSLVDVADDKAQAKRIKNNKSKTRAKSSSPSGSESPEDSSSSEDSDDSVSSVNSSDIDNEKSSSRRHRPVLADGGAMILPAGLQDLSDDQIVYRATNRMTVPLGQTEVPCGKCPVFDFCAEGGPVNAEECEYWEGWLDGGKGGGWVGEDKIQERRENEEMMEEEMNGHDGENGEQDGLMGMED